MIHPSGMFWHARGSGRRLQEHIDSPRLINFFPIRQAVPDGLARAWFCSWARWAPFFMKKNTYYKKYNTFVSILPFFSSQRREEWMDGVGWVWMTPS